MTKTLRWRQIFTGSILAILVVAAFVPIVMMLSMSFRNTIAIYTQYWGWPWPIQWSNYLYAFQYLIGPAARTIYICVASVTGISIIASLSAYALARLNFVGKRIIYAMIVGLMMVPGVVLLTPDFILATWLHLRNSANGLVAFYVGGGLLFAIFLLRTFFQSLPEELFEAARIEGATEWQALWHIAIPLSRPILITVGILNFLAIYNDLLWPLLMISNPARQTLAMALVNFAPTGSAAGALSNFSQPQLGIIAGGYVVASIPMVLVFVFGLRYFVQGLTSGALKT